MTLCVTLSNFPPFVASNVNSDKWLSIRQLMGDTKVVEFLIAMFARAGVFCLQDVYRRGDGRWVVETATEKPGRL